MRETHPHPIMDALALLGVRWMHVSALLGVTSVTVLSWRKPNPPTPTPYLRATLLLYTRQLIEQSTAALGSVPPHLVDAQRKAINKAADLYRAQETRWATDLRPVDWAAAHTRTGSLPTPT